MRKLTPLQLDYLADIAELSRRSRAQGGEGVVTAAMLMAQTPAGQSAGQSTVNRMIERLRGSGHLHHERYVGVRLTQEGEREALAMLHRQHIAEAFLVSVMGFSWHEVYEEARALRHVLKEALLHRMWQMSGQPTHSPFGEPIDADSAADADAQECLLSQGDMGRDYCIARVLIRQADRLRYLETLDLFPGTNLHLLHKAAFDGPLQIRLADGAYRIVGHPLARCITVVPPDACNTVSGPRR